MAFFVGCDLFSVNEGCVQVVYLQLHRFSLSLNAQSDYFENRLANFAVSREANICDRPNLEECGLVGDQ
jgi:hypothetical protein